MRKNCSSPAVVQQVRRSCASKPAGISHSSASSAQTSSAPPCPQAPSSRTSRRDSPALRRAPARARLRQESRAPYETYNIKTFPVLLPCFADIPERYCTGLSGKRTLLFMHRNILFPTGGLVMIEKFEHVTAETKANVYFDGKVISTRSGSRTARSARSASSCPAHTNSAPPTRR